MYKINDVKNKYQIIELATKHNDTDKIFCLLLYTKKNPHVVKCLKDDDYWGSLNERSGKLFNIYAVRPKTGNYGISGNNSNNQLTMSFLISIWEEPSDNEELISELALSDTKDLPVIYFLNKDFGEAYTVPIMGDNKEDIYNDIENIITKVYKLEQKGKFTFEELKITFKKRKVFRFLKENSATIKIASKLLLSKLN